MKLPDRLIPATFPLDGHSNFPDFCNTGGDSLIGTAYDLARKARYWFRETHGLDPVVGLPNFSAPDIMRRTCCWLMAMNEGYKPQLVVGKEDEPVIAAAEI